MNTLCQRVNFLLALALAATMLIGCQAGPKADQAVYHTHGELEALLSADVARTHAAVLQALPDLRLDVLDSGLNADSGFVTTRSATGDTIRIKMVRLEDALTRVSIRVGAFGNEAYSREILHRIRQRL